MVLGWPGRCKFARTFLWEYSYKRVKLAQFLGQIGVFFAYYFRVWSHCRFARSFTHSTPDSQTYSVPLILQRRCDRTLVAKWSRQRRPGGILAEALWPKRRRGSDRYAVAKRGLHRTIRRGMKLAYLDGLELHHDHRLLHDLLENGAVHAYE
jgi:hypothetical protein